MCIVAIGGGEVEETTLKIDKQIVELTEEENPRALFIPTASEDSDDYIERFNQTYRDKLSCETDVLRLVENNPSERQIKQKIEAADLIYVGGGNTRKMMQIWREKGVDQFLKDAYENGTVMSGLSAGAICWFENGHSDSESYETGSGEWNFIKVDGLNLVENVIFCPHYHEEDREDSFKKMMEDNPEKTGLAADNEAAIKFEDEKFELIRSKEDANAYIVKKGEITEELKENKSYSLSRL